MWQYYQRNPCGLSTGDCTVRAISKALDISWDEAHDILSEFAPNEAVRQKLMETMNMM